MVVPESDIISPDESESSLQSDQQQKIHPFSSLGRQSSIYSLTLDEFQNTLCENGKNFGSMNMDELLTSIWTAEENQAINATQPTTTLNDNDAITAPQSNNFSLNGPTANQKGGIAKQPSLPRQGSLSIPAPLRQKTVDEVWSEIHRSGQQGEQQSSADNVQNPESTTRQPTFIEMTLEYFLIKVGVGREPDEVGVSSSSQNQQQPYGMYQNNNPNVGPSFVNRPMMGMIAGPGGGGVGGTTCGVSSYQLVPKGGSAIVESSGFVGNGRRNSVCPPPPPPPPVCYGRRVVNGGGEYAASHPLGLPAPLSPVSPDAICASKVDNATGQISLDMGGLRGRKRIIDGPVEKVVERRQRRMIKNRESAARSRARKQAYTVELEAELNQLREENADLKQALAELERKRNQQYLEEMKKVQTKAQKAKERLRMIRRNMSCPL